MNTCKTCVFWDRTTEVMGRCSSGKWDYIGNDIRDGVTYTDYEGYDPESETGEDFGCIHHLQRYVK